MDFRGSGIYYRHGYFGLGWNLSAKILSSFALGSNIVKVIIEVLRVFVGWRFRIQFGPIFFGPSAQQRTVVQRICQALPTSDRPRRSQSGWLSLAVKRWTKHLHYSAILSQTRTAVLGNLQWRRPETHLKQDRSGDRYLICQCWDPDRPGQKVPCRYPG